MKEKLAPYLLVGAIALGGSGLIAEAESANDYGNQICEPIPMEIEFSGEVSVQCSDYDAYPYYNEAQIIAGVGVVTEIADVLLLGWLVAYNIRKTRRSLT